jgi:hypothetical protein
MADIKPITVPAKRLAETITGASSSFKLDNIEGWDGNDLTSSDLGSVAYAAFRNAAGTLLEIMEIDPTTIASASITISRRGLKFTGDLTTEVSANKLTWVKGDTIVELGTHFPQLLQHFVDTISDETIGGVKTFSSLPATSAGDPVGNNDLARKAYVDAAVLGTLTTINVIVPGTAGATIAAGNLVYFDDTDNEWKLCDADTATTVENVLLGIAQGAGTDGNVITGGVLLQGVDDNQSGLTAGQTMYASNTAGGISNSAGTTEVTVGISKSTTELYFAPRWNQHITEDQQDALVGTSGTPSNSNKYVTADDVSAAAASGKIVRATGTALPALDASNLTGNPALDASNMTNVVIQETLTADEAVSQYDVVAIADGTESITREDQSANTGNNVGWGTTSDTSDNTAGDLEGANVAQSIQFSRNTAIKTVVVSLKKSNSPTDNLTIEIQADSGGNPSGSALATSNVVDGSTLTGTYAATTFTFASPYTVNASTTYWLVLKRSTGSNGTNYYIAQYKKSASYSGGAVKINLNSGGWTTPTVAGDLYFQITQLAVAGRILKANASSANTRSGQVIGVATTAIALDASGVIQVAGVATMSGLTAGKKYYLSNTAGAVSTSAGSQTVKVGQSLSTTQMLIQIQEADTNL